MSVAVVDEFYADQFDGKLNLIVNFKIKTCPRNLTVLLKIGKQVS